MGTYGNIWEHVKDRETKPCTPGNKKNEKLPHGMRASGSAQFPQRLPSQLNNAGSAG